MPAVFNCITMKNPIQVPSNHFDDDELRLRCAWLYFVGDLNQAAVAEKLGITRARVNKLIAEARERNIVSVTLHARDESLRVLELEQSLARRCGLDFCVVTPPLGLRPTRDKKLQEAHRQVARRAVGIAAANFLRGQLGLGKPLTLGVGWGRTLEQMALHLHGVHNPRARFVSVMGSLTRNSASNPFEVVHTLASRTAGEGHFLPVPFIADSVSDLQVFMSQRVVREALALASQADFVLTSLGELQSHSLVVAQGMLSAREYRSLQAAGAIGDLLGRFFDASGQPVDHDLNRRTAAIDLAAMQQVPLILLVAGEDKIPPLRALMGTGLVRALVIDGDAAEVLLQSLPS